jgi:hypothetical protein
MQSLTTKEISRLVKLCGVFSSHHPGEIANAAALADKLLREHGLQWSDVIRLPIGRELDEAADSDAAVGGGDPFATWPGGWRGACEFVLRHKALLSRWEQEFASKVSGYIGNITGKQKPILRDLVDRCMQAGFRP